MHSGYPARNGSPSHGTSAEIRRGIRDTSAAALGLIPLGLAFGLLLTQTGFAWWWAPIFSFVIYAGSMEFLALSMVTSGVGPISAAVTGFMVNFRHAFYGLTYPRRNIDSAWGKVYSTYALTDESYVIVSAQPHPQELSGTRLLTIQVYAQVLWVGSGIVGALAGLGIPSDVKGMEFALTALFVVLTYDAFRASPDWSLLAVAGVCGVLAALIFPGQLLMAALIAYFVFVLARHFSPRLDSALRWERGRAAADNVSRETSRSAGEEGAAW